MLLQISQTVSERIYDVLLGRPGAPIFVFEGDMSCSPKANDWEVLRSRRTYERLTISDSSYIYTEGCGCIPSEVLGCGEMYKFRTQDISCVSRSGDFRYRAL